MKFRSLLTTPINLASESLDFAKNISPDKDILYVPVIPSPGALPNECYSNVDIQIKKEGGSSVWGWQIWEWPNFYAEAEAHAVWRNKEGSLIDITPKEEPLIAFIEDKCLGFEGIRINNIRSATKKVEVVTDFIEVGNLHYSLFGSMRNGQKLEPWQTKLASRIDKAKIILSMLFQGSGSSSRQCPCGSRLPYKDCHRGEVKRTIEMARKLAEAV